MTYCTLKQRPADNNVALTWTRTRMKRVVDLKIVDQARCHAYPKTLQTRTILEQEGAELQ